MPVSIKSEKDVTVDDIVEEATSAYRYARSIIKEKDPEEVLNLVREKHPQIFSSYPLVIKYMVYFNSYDPRAMKRYLLGVQKNPWKTEEEFLESQATYLKILYQCLNPKKSKREIDLYFQSAKNLLIDERKTFKKQVETAEDQFREKDLQLKSSYREELYQYFKNLKDE